MPYPVYSQPYLPQGCPYPHGILAWNIPAAVASNLFTCPLTPRSPLVPYLFPRPVAPRCLLTYFIQYRYMKETTQARGMVRGLCTEAMHIIPLLHTLLQGAKQTHSAFSLEVTNHKHDFWSLLDWCPCPYTNIGILRLRIPGTSHGLAISPPGGSGASRDKISQGNLRAQVFPLFHIRGK